MVDGNQVTAFVGMAARSVHPGVARRVGCGIQRFTFIVDLIVLGYGFTGFSLRGPIGIARVVRNTKFRIGILKML